MNSNDSLIEIALKRLLSSMNELRELDVLTNKKDFTCQIGEWLVEMIFDGYRSTNAIEKGWDVKIGEKRIQVKAHAKARTTTNRTTSIKYDLDARTDELIIIIFSQDYKLKEFYQLPWEIALTKIKREKHKDVIYWNHLYEYKIEFDELPKQNIIQFFR